MKACPEMPELLDHMEGRFDLSPHLERCEACSTTLADLRASLATEAALATPSPLETERALGRFHEAARASRSGRWRATVFFSAAAAMTLAFLLPSSIVGTSTAGPEGGGPGAVVSRPALDASAPRIPLDAQGSDRLHTIITNLQGEAVSSTATVHS